MSRLGVLAGGSSSCRLLGCYRPCCFASRWLQCRQPIATKCERPGQSLPSFLRDCWRVLDSNLSGRRTRPSRAGLLLRDRIAGHAWERDHSELLGHRSIRLPPGDQPLLHRVARRNRYIRTNGGPSPARLAGSSRRAGPMAYSLAWVSLSDPSGNSPGRSRVTCWLSQCLTHLLNAVGYTSPVVGQDDEAPRGG